MNDDKQKRGSLLSKKTIIGILIFTNVVSLLLMLNIHRNISKGKRQRQIELQKLDTLTYDENPYYTEQIELFDLYKHNSAKIVMLGSSFTQRVHWNELLGRSDVANRGVGSDVSAGYVNRLGSVLEADPAICFIEIGANDIIKNVPLDTIYRNTLKIVETLHDHHIEVVITKCFFTSATFEFYESFNRKADSLNSMFDLLQERNTLIDLNPLISQNEVRLAAYSLADGIHLNAAAYLLWRKEIENVLLKKNIVAN